MTVEPLVLAAIIEDGSLKEAYREGVGRNNFEVFEEEYDWIEKRYERKKPINKRVFLQRFPDFDFFVPSEDLKALIDELKNEGAFSKVNAMVESISQTLTTENAIDIAEHCREILTDVLRTHQKHSDISLKDFRDYYEGIRQHRIAIRAGEPHVLGMPTSIPSIDFNWDGLIPGRLIGVLSRPGHAKSFFVAWLAWQAIKNGWRIGLFSPEMSRDEHIARVHTLASAEKEIQEACGLTESFRNNDLNRKTGFDLKAYKRFMEYFESLPGNCYLFTKQYRISAMTIPYVATRIEDLGLQGVMADPLSKLATLKNRESPVWEMRDKVDAFQELAEEHNLWAIATNWSRRDAIGKKDEPPGEGSSYGSDALEQEADHVITLRYNEDDHELQMRCTKSRFSAKAFRVNLTFRPNTGTFREESPPLEVKEYALQLESDGRNGRSLEHYEKIEKALEKIERPVAVKPARPVAFKPAKSKREKVKL